MLNEEISSLVGGLRSSSNSSLSAFARMEQKIEALEAEAEAAGQMGVRPCWHPTHQVSSPAPEVCWVFCVGRLYLCCRQSDRGSTDSITGVCS